MRNKLACVAALMVCTLILRPNLTRAADGWDRAILSLTEENDSGLSDRHYTQGAQFSFLSQDHEVGSFLRRFPSVGYDVFVWKWGLEGGHLIFTPEDIEKETLIRDDRPYAGWAYGGLIFQQRGTNAYGSGVIETFRLQAGVVGPDSQADDIQIWWHRVFGFQRPNGWRHQLRNELGVQFGYDRRQLYKFGGAWSAQFLPEAGLALGNVRTDAHLGGMVRFGYNVPDEFAVGETGRGADFGVYLFGSARGHAVLLDIFLDGNNFRESHEVDKELWVGEGRIGIVFATRHMELSLAHVQRTNEFHDQEDRGGYNSITLTVKF
jgi:lipid A 3-O-deacylase